MKLLVTTPTDVVLDRDDVVHVRAEDETGSFGILAGHADFLTALEIGIVAWRDADRHEGYVAVRGGVLRVADGHRVAIATREAICGDDLTALEQTMVARFREEQDRDALARTAAARLQLATIRRLREFLHPEMRGAHRAATSVVAGNRRAAGPRR